MPASFTNSALETTVTNGDGLVVLTPRRRGSALLEHWSLPPWHRSENLKCPFGIVAKVLVLAHGSDESDWARGSRGSSKSDEWHRKGSGNARTDDLAGYLGLGHLLGGRLRPLRPSSWCAHRETITTVTAGMAREVCESCARIRIYYVESSVQIYSEQPRSNRGPERHAPSASSASPQCLLCSQPAVFMIPDGMRCDEHAWQAAARLDWESSELWVPIRIDRSNA
jgi:hypothetical protein